ncbi:NUDIX hydrolase [Paracoccus sp. P2]|uniref:8-oxo-dGTP diphosphatase n=1 Tax=Paracoccus pantotrophus TaxID=82367 RepID=A0A1I5GM96_PARPN|nr:NUDIX hydrolase [Paracoccus pantotrophus]MDF3854365.1 NUDIX hydrolase [Paracoccus pantotrophus]QFG38489.1 NUDIX domain-containing protein [Paracoccus pantotrophus]QLH16170.1 NUDIX hydrolase [Paracoccus pantotrophus]RDE01953.1 NUDIX domain-containing protein [Paracoccus pantotrophus]RKS50982.1 8-oxo-dGTP diphosphatase [Paracoccus pantotrophus]
MLTHGACLLTCLRDDYGWIPFPAHWDLPGGGAEPDESPVECALRELDEEFGLRLAAGRLAGRAFPSVSEPGRLSWLFSGTITATEIAVIRFGGEGQEWRMMPVAEFVAHPRAVPHFRDRVRLVLAGAGCGI